jgi:short-subunit dehydrogenase
LDVELRDKVAIVTGGNRSIGEAVAWQLATEGADVALIARDRAVLETAAADIKGATKRRVSVARESTATSRA